MSCILVLANVLRGHATGLITELLGSDRHPRRRAAVQPSLFGDEAMPEGLAYAPDSISPEEESAFAGRIAALPLRRFQFHGFEGNRRTISFGYHYAFDGTGLKRADPIPEWLRGARERAGALAGLPWDAFEHVLLIEYAPGAGIGWHRDRPVFGDVVGISLLAPARLRFRRKALPSGVEGPVLSRVEGGGNGWERAALQAEPRSAYLLRGPARTEWEHSLPAMAELRYSITLRTLKASGQL
jgi:alkylated DNA repair dioxygenase AlkB